VSTVTRGRSRPAGQSRHRPSARQRPQTPVRPPGPSARPRRRWEERLLAGLAYPANLALAGLAATVIALGIITVLPAAVAASRALDAWLREGEDAVFTGTFRELRATWRRTLPLGVGATVCTAVLTVNAVFLWHRSEGGTDGPALVLGAATVVVGCSLALLVLAIPVAATRSPDAGARAWGVEAAALVAGRPVRAVVLLALVVALLATLWLLPTLAPFVAISGPAYLALVTLGHQPSAERPE
jgi:uncharacterized membrane protein YesL